MPECGRRSFSSAVTWGLPGAFALVMSNEIASKLFEGCADSRSRVEDGGDPLPEARQCTANPANYVVGEGELTGFTDSGATVSVIEAVTVAILRPTVARLGWASADASAPRAVRVRHCECRL